MWVPKGRSIYWCSKCRHEHINTLNNGLPEYCPVCGNDQYPIKMPKLNTKQNSKEDE